MARSKVAVAMNGTAAASKKGRRAANAFPTTSFEETLTLAAAIHEHGVGGKIRRTTVFDKLKRSPESGPSRQLVTNSSKYGLTTGGYQAEHLELTAKGELAVSNRESRESREAAFELSIAGIEAFEQLYDRLKNKKIPSQDVLCDELGSIGVPEDDRARGAQVFLDNARYLGLVKELSGANRLVTIEEVLEALETAAATQDGREVKTARTKPDEPKRQPDEPPAPAMPAVHIDIQIHIDSTASAEQIDQIFASMARHIYGRK
jgi:hypothetical protein